VKITEGGNDGIDIVRTSSGRERGRPGGYPQGQGDRAAKQERKREKRACGSTLAGVLESFVDRLSC
jgi:hypothetical protein